MLVFVLLFTSPHLSPRGFLWVAFSKALVASFGLSPLKPIGANLAPFIFVFILRLMVSGILPYAVFYLGSLRLILFLSYGFWLRTFLYAIRSRRLAFLLFHREHGIFLASFLLPIEIMSLLVKPVALAVRIYANLMFGHYLLYYAFFVVSYLGPLFYWLVAPLFIFELGVFVIQRYIFTYLLVLYLGE